MTKLLLLILIHAMMQQFSVAEGFKCNQISCETDCVNSTLPSIHDINSDGHHERNKTIDLCCKFLCREFCTHDLDGSVHPHGDEWTSDLDPCSIFRCDYGTIYTQKPACKPISCPVEFHYQPSTECCPKCDSSWADFCDKNNDCDWACQFGYVRNETGNCDLCKCRPRDATQPTTATEKSTTLPTATMTESTTEFVILSSSSAQPKMPDDYDASPEHDDDDDVVHVDKNIWPIYDRETQQLLVFAITALSTVLLVACIMGIGFWCLHRRAYKPLPLLNSSSMGGSTA